MHYCIVFGSLADPRVQSFLGRTICWFGDGRRVVCLAEGVLGATVERASIERAHRIVLRVIVLLFNFILVSGFWNDLDLVVLDDLVLSECLAWIGPPNIAFVLVFVIGVHRLELFYMYCFSSRCGPLLVEIRALDL